MLSHYQLIVNVERALPTFIGGEANGTLKEMSFEARGVSFVLHKALAMKTSMPLLLFYSIAEEAAFCPYLARSPTPTLIKFI